MTTQSKLHGPIGESEVAISDVALSAWLCWQAHGWVICPRKPKTTCTDPKCKIGISCNAMAQYGLAGDGTPLPHALRPPCGAKNREDHPCRNRVVPGKCRCKFHGGLSTGPRTLEGRARIAAAQRRRWNKLPLVGVDPYVEGDDGPSGDSFMGI